jgi:hypothetical protein
VSPRARWLVRWLGPSAVWLVSAVVFAAVGELAAAIVCLGSAVSSAALAVGSLWSFRAGYFQGRGSQLVDVERRRLGLHVERLHVEDVNPWDAWPEWPSASDPGHTLKNRA